MPRRSRRARLIALALELGGIAAILSVLAYFSLPAAIVVLGCVAIVAAQVPEKLL